MSKRSKRASKRELKQARQDADRAYERVLSGCAKTPEYADDQSSERSFLRTRIYPYLQREREKHLRHLADIGVVDGAVYLQIFDVDDCALLRAQARVLSLEGNAAAAADLEEGARAGARIEYHERSELLTNLKDSGWDEITLGYLRQQAPPMALLVVYDGTVCGHGTCVILPPMKTAGRA